MSPETQRNEKNECISVPGIIVPVIVVESPEFSMSKGITWQVDMDNRKLGELGYNMNIGRDLLQALKVVIYFEYQVLKWDDTSIPMNITKLSK